MASTMTMLSASAAEFVPVWSATPREPMPTMPSKDGTGYGNFMLNMDQYSDDSSSDEAPPMKQSLTSSKVDAGQPAQQRTHSPPSEPAAEPTPSPEKEAAAKAAKAKKAADASQATKADQEGVPAPWYRKESSKYPGRFYYVNQVTGKTIWTKPEMPVKEPSEHEPEAEELPLSGDSPTAARKTVDEPAAVPTTFVTEYLLRWRQVAADEFGDDSLQIVAEMQAAPAPAAVPATSSAASDVLSWRTRSNLTSRSNPPPSPKVEKLEVSSSSWAAKQRARRGGGSSPVSAEEAADAEVVRTIRATLNKISIEKFPQLSKQLMECKYTCSSHVKILIKEVFEKATTQHHYIDMYTDLCELLHEFFVQNPVSDDPKCGFKRLLLGECQNSFERNLHAPSDLHELDPEERTLAEVRYKTRMLGNIRFVGALLARHMLASKVLIAILEELMGDPTPEALESVATLLTVTGPVFDTTDWSHSKQFNAVFAQVKDMCKKKTCHARARCLLQDVLDLRAQGWKNQRPIRMETPTTLEAVAQKKADEDWKMKGW